jgi:hypothetical protein
MGVDVLPSTPSIASDSPVANPPNGTAPSLLYDSEAEHQDQLESVFWFQDQRSAGAFRAYEGKYVVVSGQTILDADFEMQALVQRVERSYAPPLIRRMVIQYVPRLAGWTLR